MTKDGDYVHKDIHCNSCRQSYQIKVVANKVQILKQKVWNQTWFGIREYKDNLTFNVTDTCDVTVTFNPATNEINVTGDNVKVVTDLKLTPLQQ